MTIYKTICLTLLAVAIPLSSAHAESYVDVSLGRSFSGRLSNLIGDENINYSDGPTSVYPNTGRSGGTALYKDAAISDLRLEDTLAGGIRIGHYFDQYRALGLELEMNYSRPNLFRQNVTLTHPGFNDATNGLRLGQNHFTEDQSSAEVLLLQIGLHGLYRFQGFDRIVPYIGGGPAIHIFRIMGTGDSGVITNPALIADPDGVDGPSVHETSVNLGLNLKLGAEYRIDDLWGLGMEYCYSWSPVEISSFRSISNADGDFTSRALRVVMRRHF